MNIWEHTVKFVLCLFSTSAHLLLQACRADSETVTLVKSLCYSGNEQSLHTAVRGDSGEVTSGFLMNL